MVKKIEIHGHCDPKFASIKDVLLGSIESDADLGASFSAVIDGETVIDIWAGHLDEDRTRQWQEDTIINVYSTTKTMSFLCALVLAERGLLNFDANVAEYWPEFAQNGKEQVKVWHLMNHAAGLSGTDEPLVGDDLFDWDKVVNALAKQAPWWEPGTATAYHAMTQGFLIGEVVKRISGRTIGTFFQEEIAKPLGADFFIGVPESEFSRIADLIPPGGDATLPSVGEKGSIAYRTFKYPATSALASRSNGWRGAEIPAANGHGNARSVAKIHSLLACKGESGGVRLLSPELAESVMTPRIEGDDMALGTPVSFGLGFGINTAGLLAPNKNVCYWGGWGGSFAMIDQDARMSFSYVMNKMHVGLMGDMRSYNLSQALYKALG